MIQENAELRLKLAALAQLEADMLRAYDEAIRIVKTPEIQARLKEFRRDHVRHGADLAPELSRVGGSPVAADELKDVDGDLLVRDAALVDGVEGALRSMWTNEQLALEQYEAILKTDLPNSIRCTLERHVAEERRHLASLETAIGNASPEPKI